LLAGFLATVAALANDSFQRIHHVLDHPIDGDLVPMKTAQGPGLLAVGRSGDEWRYSIIVPGMANPINSGALPAQAVFFDVCPRADSAHEAVCILTAEGIRRLDPEPAEAEIVLATESLYRGPTSGGPVHRDFIRDIDGDGRADVLLPGFSGWTVQLNREEGPQRSELRQVPATTVEDGRVSYAPRTPIILDMNTDGLVDVSFLEGARLATFLQDRDGRFKAEPIMTGLDTPLATEQEMVRLRETDQSRLEFEELERAMDFNGDGLLDLLTDKTISRGVFDRRSEYHLYLGQRDAGATLLLGAVPDGSIRSDGFQLEPIVYDIDGDGLLDIATPTTELGLGRVIGALLSGKVGIDLNVFRLRGNGQFPEDADFSEKTRVEFDLSTGFTRTPAIRIADFDGDGRGDLLLQTEPDELSFHPGHDRPSLFRSSPSRIQISLPNDGRMVRADDVDGDGRPDIVIRYGTSDGEEATRHLRLLLGRPETPP
jgi:hypothetical protein